ncbi:Nucleic-acid-binding protein from transposon X-element [Eumeta japonica]|uniref:Nucleic-acid-binding protein from transposon X-element n=1 Tax=Eumeta variegata TaxID=151549 RepID=A0A4C1TVE4_EUMVA|nr:Nucleic-acid-binding protein from transposon X-element [Eumeta japonica]
MDKTPGPPGTGSPKRAHKSLSLDELKSLFFSFLQNQGYAVPAEANSILNDVGSASIASRREQSLSPSVRTRRNSWISHILLLLLKSSKSSNDSRDSDIYTKPCKGKLTEYTDSPASPGPSASQKSVTGHKQTTSERKSDPAVGNKPSPPPRSKPPPPICLRGKSKWNMVSSEYTRLHINYTRAHNTNQGIRITAVSIDDFRKLSTLLIKSNFPFHIYTLEEERKLKAVLKGIPLEFETEDIKLDLERQGYSVLAVHRMHHRAGTALGMSLIILESCHRTMDIFKKLFNICGLSGLIVEAPYRRGKPDQCHHCQLYGHSSANCHAQLQCVKCLVPNWTNDCNRNRESGDKPSCCNCGKDHTANYGEYPEKINSLHQNKKLGNLRERLAFQIPDQPAGTIFVRAHRIPTVNQWKKPLPWLNRNKIPNNKGTPKSQLNSTGTAASALGEEKHNYVYPPSVSVYLLPKKELLQSDLKILFALGDAVILFGDFNSKNTNWNCKYSNRNGRKMVDLTRDLHFNIVAPPTPTHYPFNDNHRPDILDIALIKGVALRLSCIETLRCLNSDHRPVLIRLGSLTGDCSPLNKTITNWQKVSTVLEEIDTPILNNVPNDIVSTGDIDNAIGTLTNHIRTVVDNSSWKAVRKPDKSVAFDDRENAECLADSIESARHSENPPYDLEHVRRMEEDVRHRVSLPPKDDLDPITHDEISKHIKSLKIRKAPGMNSISNKALKCFSAPLVAFLVAIFNTCIKSCYFPTAWKEAVFIGISKPGKPHDLPAS